MFENLWERKRDRERQSILFTVLNGRLSSLLLTWRHASDLRQWCWREVIGSYRKADRKSNRLLFFHWRAATRGRFIFPNGRRHGGYNVTLCLNIVYACVFSRRICDLCVECLQQGSCLKDARRRETIINKLINNTTNSTVGVRQLRASFQVGANPQEWNLLGNRMECSLGQRSMIIGVLGLKWVEIMGKIASCHTECLKPTPLWRNSECFSSQPLSARIVLWRLPRL